MKYKQIVAAMLSIAVMASSLACVAFAQVEAPNVDKTTTEPLAPSDNLLPEAKEIKDVDFSDATGHWAEPTIKALSANSYVQGMGNGTFAPEKNVTRAEFVTMAVNALGLEKIPYQGGITDVEAGIWYADVIQAAYDGELLEEVLFIEGKFMPNTDITREDAALIIAKAALKNGAAIHDIAFDFTDITEISSYALTGVNQACAMGLLTGYPDGSFKPKASLTRAEASELLLRAIEVKMPITIYVDPETGDDAAKGTKSAPLKTVAKATELVKQYNDDMDDHIFVFLKGGEHYVEEAIKLNAEHSGSNGYNVVYTSYGDEVAQLMMAKSYSGFKLADEKLNIYKVYVGDTMSRQVYVNGVRATRAKSDVELTNAELTDFGYYCDDAFLADYKNIQDLETVCYSCWTQPRCGVSEITIEENGRTKIVMDKEPWELNLTDNSPWTLPYWYENAYELLNIPGEWYIDSTDGYLYYIPRPFEDPKTMVATVPTGERILTIDGTVDAPAHNMTFDNLEFAYTTWMYPSGDMGLIDGQNCFVNGSLPESAIRIYRSRYIDFTNNTFNKLGAAALQMMYSIQECDVIGNEFKDLSGTAVSLGKGPGDEWETEIKPTEYKYYTINNRINNNYIHDVGIDYGSSSAISATWPKNTQINHNEIANVNYSGMHIGYGWGGYAEDKENKGTGLYGVELCYNYIHDVMNSKLYDGGCIYTLGATGGTYENPNLWTNNYFENSRNAYGCIYPDEGSTFWLIEDNVVDYNDVDIWKRSYRNDDFPLRWIHIHTDSIRYNTVRNNYTTPAQRYTMSPYNNVEDAIVCKDGKWPQEAQNIMAEAGLQSEYLEKLPAEVQRFNVNQDSYVAQVGDTRQIKITAYGRKQEVASKDSYDVYYASSRPEIASVDEDGKITILDEGEVTVYVNVLADGIIRTKEVKVICGDKLARVRLDSPDITVIKDFTYTITPTGVSELGRRLQVEEAVYTVEDESIAYIDEDNNVVGRAVGETVVHAKFRIDDVTVEEDIPVEVISYGKEGSEKLSSTKLSGDFFDPANWVNGQKSVDGTGVSLTGSANYYSKEKLADGLYSFDMRIDNPNSWPSLALNAPDPTKTYANSDLYFIGFKPDHIEVQKFNNGVRTMFFGDVSLSPIEGAGIPNTGIFEYGKTHHVTVGTIEEEEGVRIILTIDGKNILDYLDKTDNPLRADGHLGVYVGSGTFTFSPYTGK